MALPSIQTEVRANIDVVQPRKLSQQFLRSLVPHWREDDLNLDEQIAGLAAGDWGRHTVAADSQPLAGCRAGRNPDPGGAVERGDVHLRAKRGLVDGDRQRQHQVAAGTPQERVRPH
jgi:hypothetical protein